MGWGDEIIVTGIARRLQEKSRRRVLVLDKAGRRRWHAIWEGNPRLAHPEWGGQVQTVVNGPGRRPYIRRETRSRWIWRDWICPVGEIALTARERVFGQSHAGRIVLEPNLTEKASPNKDWGWQRWSEMVRLLRAQGHVVTQLGPAGTRLLPGAEHLQTRGFRDACAVLAAARLAILPEGGLHHAAAALGTPSIVIFGGYISAQQTGYPHQLNLDGGGEACGMRVRCLHCAAVMKRIDPAQVFDHAAALLRLTRDDCGDP
jgi:ADP-heptose:LPS heptosyltransferase